MSDTTPSAQVDPTAARIQKLQFIFDAARKAPLDASTHETVKQVAIELSQDLNKLAQYERAATATDSEAEPTPKVDPKAIRAAAADLAETAAALNSKAEAPAAS